MSALAIIFTDIMRGQHVVNEFFWRRKRNMFEDRPIWQSDISEVSK